MSRPNPLPVATTLGVAVAVAGAAIWLLTVPGLVPASDAATVAVAVLAGALAAGLGRVFRLGDAWLVLIAVATPLLVVVPIYRPPNWIFPLAVLVLAGFYVNGVREKVPLYLSNRRTVAALAALIPAREGARVIDLGCGLGGVVAGLARARPDARVLGVETAPLSFLCAWIRIAVFGPGNAEIRFESIWETDVGGADLVYAFLSPAPMRRLNDRLAAEMKPGAVFVSNSFAVPGKAPDDIVDVGDRRRTRLLIWRT